MAAPKKPAKDKHSVEIKTKLRPGSVKPFSREMKRRGMNKAELVRYILEERYACKEVEA